MLRNRKKATLTSVALLGLLLSLSACDNSDGEDSSPESEASEESSENPAGEGQMPEANTDDIPDVVATVNGEDISKDDFVPVYEQQFPQIAMQSQAAGQEVDEDTIRTQVLDNLVDNELLIQEALSDGEDVTDDEIDSVLEEAAEQQGLESADDFVGLYEEQGQTEEDLREDAAHQFAINRLIDTLDVEDPTDEQVEEAYDQYVQQQEMMLEQQESSEDASSDDESDEDSSNDTEADVPSLDEVRDELETQIESQNQQSALLALVEELREDAEIETHI